ncbi:GDP-mannose 4,6-dehydratase [Candidatus Pelagibacter bacterium]|nr:GDP-mannose 4,6-dehydratase [Candidatus Pelagibacter bacterium]MDA8834328.1 GDP-mannose 4,6-dehydratase [Candidatus Pelagibacter bacterium]
MKKKALILGITGQDGSYLAEFLLKKKYQIHGIKRRTSTPNTSRIDHIFDSINFDNKKLIMHHGDLSDSGSLNRIINSINPDEIYNLAAQSHVKISFQIPEYTSDVNALGPLRLLEIIRHYKRKKIKFYQASSSEMFGKSKPPQNESTIFQPRSVYAISKIFAFNTVVHYREAYGIHASNGILFNHESPRRGVNFVTRKIIQGLLRIKKGEQNILTLGNLYSKRDWGHAKDYVESMWKILQHKKPNDFVVATNKSYSVKDFVNISAKKIGFKIKWINKGLKEEGIDEITKKKIINVSKKYFRETEVDNLIGDFSKAKKILKWKPKYSLNQLIDDMIQNEE